MLSTCLKQCILICFIPILLPTRIVDNARPSLPVNIFTNTLDLDIICGNLLDKITDHLPKFIVLNNAKPPDSKIKVTRRDYSKLVEQDYLHDLDNIQVSELMIETNDTNEKYKYSRHIFTPYLISMHL